MPQTMVNIVIPEISAEMSTMLVLNENNNGLKITIIEKIINVLLDSENQGRYFNLIN